MAGEIKIAAINGRTVIVERNARHVALRLADAPADIDPDRLEADGVGAALADVIDSHPEVQVMGWSTLQQFLAVRGIDAAFLLARTNEPKP